MGRNSSGVRSSQRYASDSVWKAIRKVGGGVFSNRSYNQITRGIASLSTSERKKVAAYAKLMVDKIQNRKGFHIFKHGNTVSGWREIARLASK